MSFAACAALVHDGDPDRFLATMTAVPDLRGPLFVLYAFNLELARAGRVTNEPMIAQMRLQFWRDCLDQAAEGGEPRAHEVAGPLMSLVAENRLKPDFAHQMIDAYSRALAPEFPETDEALDSFLRDTGGALMALAGGFVALDLNPDPLIDFGTGAATANLLRALPKFEQQGKRMLLDGRQGPIATKAKTALDQMRSARSKLNSKTLLPVLRTAFLAEPILKTACKNPEKVATGTLEPTEFSRRLRMIALVAAGRY